MVVLKTYTVTAFEKDGKKIIDQTFTANNDAEAKTKGEEILRENEALEKTHRVVSPEGRLLLFHT